jgi:hypothetical protein
MLSRQRAREGAVAWDRSDLTTYGACAALVILYAAGRFNTPPSNRSSTSQPLYWRNRIGYVASALLLFMALSLLLQSGQWRELLGLTGKASLSAPLIATLAMTTLIPSVPYVKRVDEWLLSLFLGWAEIPAEVKRRAAAMTPESFVVTKAEVAELRDAYDELADHLRDRGNTGLALSQYHLTRVVKLYDRLRKLAGERRYGRFFTEFATEYATLDRQMLNFLRRAEARLTIGARLRAVEQERGYEELVQERREVFAQGCRDMFQELALFLARAVLRSEPSENEVAVRLRRIGFPAAEPGNAPRFPIDSLTVLAVGAFVYLTLSSVWFANLAPQVQPHGGPAITAKIALIRLATVGLTVWLMQHCAFFRRAPGDPPRYFGYLVNGLAASAAATGICLIFEAGHQDILGRVQANDNLTPIFLSGVLSSAVAFCCDDWPENSPPPFWLRWAEATGCAVVMAGGLMMLVWWRLLPLAIDQLPGRAIFALFGLPSALAFIIGACVPQLYRAARLAANTRRAEIRPAPAGTTPAGAPLIELSQFPM